MIKWISSADVAELADAQDLGSCEETHAGSIPVIRIKMLICKIKNIPNKNKNVFYFFLDKKDKACFNISKALKGIEIQCIRTKL